MGTKLYVEPKKLKNISNDLEKNSKEVLKLTQRMNEVKSNISSLGIDKSENLVKSLELLSNQMNSEYKSLHKIGSSLTSVSSIYSTVEKKVVGYQISGLADISEKKKPDKKQNTKTSEKKENKDEAKKSTKKEPKKPSSNKTSGVVSGKDTKKDNTATSSIEPKNEQVKKYVDNMCKNLNYSKDKMLTIKVMGTTLLNEGYEPAFVAGILGNMMKEGGRLGVFENSTYIKNPEPDYLLYMDRNFSYRSKFSNKSITTVGISDTEKVLQKLEKSNYKGQFGLGCVQWTGSRTKSLIECYKKVCGNNNYPTKEQCMQAESMQIAKELKGGYKGVYTNWLKTKGGATSAARIVCEQYEKPKDNTSVERGQIAQIIYNAMMGK